MKHAIICFLAAILAGGSFTYMYRHILQTYGKMPPARQAVLNNTMSHFGHEQDQWPQKPQNMKFSHKP